MAAEWMRMAFWLSKFNATHLKWQGERMSELARRRSRIVSTETLEIDTLQCSNSIVTIVKTFKRQKLFD